MSNNCSVCGGEITRDYLKWATDISDCSVIEAYTKGRLSTFIHAYEESGGHKINKKYYLVNYDLHVHGTCRRVREKEICLACAVLGYRECYFCGSQYKEFDEESFTGHLEIAKQIFDDRLYDDISDVNYFSIEEPMYDEHGYISKYYSYANSCGNGNCKIYHDVLTAKIKYKGYTKDRDAILSSFYRGAISNDFSDFEVIAAACAVKASSEIFKKNRKK